MTTNPATENNSNSVSSFSEYTFCDTQMSLEESSKSFVPGDDDMEDTGACAEWVHGDNNSIMEKPNGSMDRTVIINNLCDEYKKLSIQAQKFIVKNFDINKILRIRETMQPEDFDEYGPTEENWDLFVQTRDKNVHYFSYHHLWKHGERIGYS
jgi:hypothetical protein